MKTNFLIATVTAGHFYALIFHVAVQIKMLALFTLSIIIQIQSRNIYVPAATTACCRMTNADWDLITCLWMMMRGCYK